MFESLRSLSDHQLLDNTDAIVRQDRKLTLRLLVHLNEIERRQLYLTLGYSSMFDYCTRRLMLSQPAAARRLRTARSMARFPELYAMLESGGVSLSTISLASKVLKHNNFATVIDRIHGKSQREVRAIVAEYEPRIAFPPDRVTPVMVAIPVSAEPLLFGGADNHCRSDSEKSPGHSPKAEDRRAGDSHASPAATVSSSTAARLERRAVMQFTAREELITKLERVRSLASHKLRGKASIGDVIELLADEFLKRQDPAARHERREMRVARSAAAVDRHLPRAIPTRVRDQVLVRDKQRCTYVSPGGTRCDSTEVLQIDHIKPVARGGASTVENLRVLCAYHNRLEAERLMGKRAPAARSSSP